MSADPDEVRTPYVVRFVPTGERPPVELARAWTRRAGLRATFGHAARLMAAGEHGAVGLVQESHALGDVVVQREVLA